MTQSELKAVLDCLGTFDRRRIIDELQKEAKFQVDGFQGKASNAPNDRVAMSLMRRQRAYNLFQSKVKLLCPELDDVYRDGYSQEKALDMLTENNAAAVGLSILVNEGRLDDDVLQRLKTNKPVTIDKQENPCLPEKCEYLKSEKDAIKQLRKKLREAKDFAQERENTITELKNSLREKEEYIRIKDEEISKLHALLTETTEAHRKDCEEKLHIVEEKYIARMQKDHEAYNNHTFLNRRAEKKCVVTPSSLASMSLCSTLSYSDA